MALGKLALNWAVAAAIVCAGEAEITRKDWESSMLWAKVSVEQGNWEEAVRVFQTATENAPDRKSRLMALTNLGLVYSELGRYAEGERVLCHAVREHRASGGADPCALVVALNNLGSLYTESCRPGKAKPLLVEALEVYRRNGCRNPLVHAAIWNGLAEVESIYGDFDAADSHYREAMRILEARYGSSHESVGVVQLNIGLLALKSGDAAEAERCARRTLDIWSATLPGSHPYGALGLRCLGRALAAQHRFAAAADSYRRALNLGEKSLGPYHPRVGEILLDYSSTLRKLKQKENAKTMKQRGLAILRRNEKENLLQHTLDASAFIRQKP